MRKLFGTDGIRGEANESPMTVSTALNLGRAVAHRFSSKAHKGRIVVGKDTRLSCYMFENALAAGICSMGADCWFCGPIPTPAVAHITKSMRADAGLVISASHNPYYDNGIKVFGHDGFKLPDATELELESLMASGKLDQFHATRGDIGRVTRIEGVHGRYISYLKHTFPEKLTLEGLKIVVDCANGASYEVAPWVFSELGADVISIGVKPNGLNINDGCGALYPEQLQKTVVKQGADIGVALDGDADRVIVIDEQGRMVDGDVLMAIIATGMLQENKLNKKTLVSTVMSNIGLERCIEAAGGHMIRTQVGDRYVVDEMRRGGYNFGGEQSGHLVLLDQCTTGDGVVGALQVLASMVRQKKPLSALTSVMTVVPQVLMGVPVREKKPLQDIPGYTAAVDAAVNELGRDGRVLVRYSGTEKKARIMIEGLDADQNNRIATSICDIISKEVGLD